LSDIILQATESIGLRVPLSKIDAIVAKHLGPARVQGNAQPNALYRQIAMYLGKHVGGWSTTQIGKFYNGREHSTVCYAIRRIKCLRRRDSSLDALIARLMELCRADNSEPIVSAKITGMVLRDKDHALIEELADRIADHLISRLRLDALPNAGFFRQDL
jgi:hypothetical protein